MSEVRLGGGRGTTGVVRVGETVHRPTGPWTPTIHAYLRHLRSNGFSAAPDVLGFDEQGREVLTYIAGETWGDTIDPDEPKTELVVPRPWPPATRSEETLAAIGALVRRLHDASRGFRPYQPVWHEYEIPMRDDEIVCHGDVGPWNLVYRGSAPVGIIDWDNACPARPVEDLARTAWHVVPLAPDDVLAVHGFAPPYRTAERLRILVDAYGLVGRTTFVDVLALTKQLSPMSLRYWQPLSARGAAAWLRVVVRDLEWLTSASGDLQRALRD